MKYNLNNKILEAINQGIKFALDDFEDQDEIQGQVNSKVSHQHGIKEYLDDEKLFKDNFINLGLPSGTYWCKYNLGVNPDQLNTSEDWYGDYYARGETKPKKIFKQINYKFKNLVKNKLTKYTEKYKINTLQLEDVAAYQNFHFNNNINCHIPDIDQFQELISYTNQRWIKNFNPLKNTHKADDNGISGLNGRLFTSKINGNKLFIPAGGGYYEPYPENTFASINNKGIVNTGVDGYIWMNNTNILNPEFADTFHIKQSFDCVQRCAETRFNGFNVRPVLNLNE